MAKGIEIDAMSDAIMDELENYKDLAFSGLKKAVDKTANQVRDEVKTKSPKSGRKNKHYKDQWTTKTTVNTSAEYSKTVCNRKYQLTHLLEYGHAKRNGGRVRAFPHIRPAEQHGVETFEKLLKEELK